MDQRQGRIYFALFLSVAIWMGINMIFFPPPPPKPNSSIETTEGETSSNSDIGSPAKTTAEITKPESKLTTPQTDLNLKPVDPKDVQKFSFVTSSFLVRFSSLGGRIEQFYVKNYPDLKGKEVHIIKTDDHAIEFDGNKYKAIEISRDNGFDFNPILEKDNIPNSIFNQINFKPTFDEQNLKITFSAPSPDGSYILSKEYQFFPQENYFKFQLRITNPTQKPLDLKGKEDLAYFRGFGSLGPVRFGENGELSDRDKAHYFRFYYLDGSFKDHVDGTSTEGFFDSMFGSDQGKDKRFENKVALGEGLDFAGTGSRYFIAVLDPLGHSPAGLVLDNRTKNESGVILAYDNWKIEPGKSLDLDFAAYVGIRESDGMSFRSDKLDPNQSRTSPFKGLSTVLDKSFNQGITTPFRNGIVWLLELIHDNVVANYGWAIILFGILFKIVFYPLNKKQAESMKKMQELSPQIQAINEKYANDATVKQQKIMELYKKHNANPMSGCLPMLIQIPIFIALYTAFSDTIDLWNSPFLWVDDLSEPDTVFYLPGIMGLGSIAVNILPLIMVISQVVQTRLTAVSNDPNQKMMMYMMPIVMLYFFWTMPSGVTLYWTVQNILSIAQQLYTNKFDKDAHIKKS